MEKVLCKKNQEREGYIVKHEDTIKYSCTTQSPPETLTCRDGVFFKKGATEIKWTPDKKLCPDKRQQKHRTCGEARKEHKERIRKGQEKQG